MVPTLLFSAQLSNFLNNFIKQSKKVVPVLFVVQKNQIKGIIFNHQIAEGKDAL
jgi:hypothetical protein